MILRHQQGAALRSIRNIQRSPITVRAPPCPACQPSPLALGIRYNSSAPRDPRFPPEIRTKASQQQTETSQVDSATEESTKDKVSKAWSTPTRWYSIPIGLGALVLLAVQFRKQSRGELEVESQGQEGAVVRSKRVDGPWQVRVLGALPLRSLSQLWGYLNGLVLPVWFRPFGFKLYAKIFGCNLDEVPNDLASYESLGDFFYREIREGARPIADAPMVSPADGRVLHFGEIVGQRVEQVKGLTYSLEALLGSETASYGQATNISSEDDSEVVQHEKFAEINDIPYSLSSLLGRDSGEGEDKSVADASLPKVPGTHEADASHHSVDQDLKHDATVAAKVGANVADSKTGPQQELPRLSGGNKLFFLVVYLAPGDYHRFHSPTSWIVERRRHFTGDLFSVSPYIANRMKDLFVLNERVALLGRWRHGFYSMVPVGATNVGSIRINFDKALRTNTRHLSHPPHTYAEAVYSSASVLKGQPLLAGEEMGGFKLGSTIVLVFEAPADWKFAVKAGEKVKMGQALGRLSKD